jgi:thioredoxin-related protein
MKNNLAAFLFVFFPLVCLTQSVIAQVNEDPLRWYQWDEGILKAYNTKKFMLVDVYTDWCGWCQKMDQGTYANSTVQELLVKSFIPVRFNAESEDLITIGTTRYTQIEWAKKIGIKVYPTILVYDEQLQLVAQGNYFTAPEFVQFLKYIQGKYYKLCSFEDYMQKNNQ